MLFDIIFEVGLIPPLLVTQRQKNVVASLAYAHELDHLMAVKVDRYVIPDHNRVQAEQVITQVKVLHTCLLFI